VADVIVPLLLNITLWPFIYAFSGPFWLLSAPTVKA